MMHQLLRAMPRERLPRLAVPTLEQTSNRMLDSLRTLSPMSSSDFASEERAWRDALSDGSDARSLHAVLLHHEEEVAAALRMDQRPNESYMTAYINELVAKDRRPLHLRSLVGAACPLMSRGYNRPGRTGASETASMATAATLSFYENIDENKEVEADADMVTGEKYDLAVYRDLPSGRWVPGARADAYKASKRRGIQAERAQHICVWSHNQPFWVRVIERNETRTSVHSLAARFDKVLEESKKRLAEAGGPRGVVPWSALTTMKRNEWAEAYARLCTDPTNAKLLNEEIGGALFHLCLDEDAPEERSLASILYSSGNRWYDQGLSIVIKSNGLWGHVSSKADPLSRISGLLQGELEGNDGIQIDPQKGAMPLAAGRDAVRPIELQDELVAETARRARESFRAPKNAVTKRVLGFGVDFCTKEGVNADSVAEMALRLASRRVSKGQCLPSAHLVSNRGFQGGTHERLRPATSEALSFVQEAVDCLGSDEGRGHALRKACERHASDALSASKGQGGFDNHLRCLRALSEQSGKELPFLQGKGYELLSAGTAWTSAHLAHSKRGLQSDTIIGSSSDHSTVTVQHSSRTFKFTFLQPDGEEEAFREFAEAATRSLTDCKGWLEASRLIPAKTPDLETKSN